MRWWIKQPLLLLACGALAWAANPNPVDFGMSEYNAAVAARNLKYKPKIIAELNLEPPETWRIDTYIKGGAHITGGDLRGLMYGLLEAADQIRATGRLKLARGSPAAPIRGVRIYAQTDAPWFNYAGFWNEYFPNLARARFNRVQIIFEGQPGDRDMAALRMISQTGAQYGVDLVLGLSGASPETLEKLAEDCPLVRAIALHSPSSAEDPDAIFRALHNTGRRIVLELPAGAGEARGGPVRYFAPYGSAPATHPADFYLELEAEHMSYDPENVRSVLNGVGAGFEIPSPADSAGRPDASKIAIWGKIGYTTK